MIRYVATNLTDLHRDPTFQSELMTQVTNGVALEVLREDGKWCYVRQTDGYEGWAYTPFMTTASPPAPTHVVAIPMIGLFAEPSKGTFATRLLAGTKVRVVEPKDTWRRIELVGERFAGGWVPVFDEADRHLRPLDRLPFDSKVARTQILDDARQFTGTYYLWGGCTAWGIDCSGLAQLAHRLGGYEIPRDCVLQFPVGQVIEPPFRTGDLLYFWNEARTKVGHVGIATGEGWNIIHSSRARDGVYEEDVQANENLKASYAGARTFLP